MNARLDILKGARALMERGWTVGYMARDANDEPTPWEKDGACKFCAYGAIMRASRDLYNDSLLGENTMTFMDSFAPDEKGIILFNDYHDKEEVLAVFDAAIAKEQAA